MSSETETSAEYIHHHLQNLTWVICRMERGELHIPRNKQRQWFLALNLDTLIMSFLLARHSY